MRSWLRNQSKSLQKKVETRAEGNSQHAHAKSARVREIRCDLFSIQSSAHALRVQTEEVHFWIEQNGLQATVSTKGKRKSYIITPEALEVLYKNHLPKILAHGGLNQALFEAKLQYCFSPKHTLDEQLLDVRRDKRERAANLHLLMGQAYSHWRCAAVSLVRTLGYVSTLIDERSVFRLPCGEESSWAL